LTHNHYQKERTVTVSEKGLKLRGPRLTKAIRACRSEAQLVALLQSPGLGDSGRQAVRAEMRKRFGYDDLGATEASPSPQPSPWQGEGEEGSRCRVCGCTEAHACPGGCYWVEQPGADGLGLCSRCVGKAVPIERAKPLLTDHTESRPVRLADIRLDGNIRQTDLEAPKFAELLASIKRVGVIQPVALHRAPQPGAAVPQLTLICGRRRLAAAELAELTEIPAIIYTDLTDADIAELRFTENMDRADLTVIEEGVAFADMESKGFRPSDLAARIGKAPGYVHDRLRIVRKVNKKLWPWIAEGKLQVEIALDLAALDDEDEQLEIIDPGDEYGWARTIRDGGRLKPAEIRQHVLNRLCKLGGVDWDKTVEFAGRPPCNGCGSNSNTQPFLFGHVEGADDGGAVEKHRCSNPACYRHKTDAARKLLAEVTKAKAKPAEMVEAMASKGLRVPAALKDAAKKGLAKPPAKKTVSGASSYGGSYKDLPRDCPVMRWQDAIVGWSKQIVERFRDSIDVTAPAWRAEAIADELVGGDGYGYSDGVCSMWSAKDRQAVRPLLARLLLAGCKGKADGLLAKLLHQVRDNATFDWIEGYGSYGRTESDMQAVIERNVADFVERAAAAGCAVDPATTPKLEDYQPGGAKAASTKATKKATKKKGKK
jgi:ParB/RepB/Spo0J family partition protein